MAVGTATIDFGASPGSNEASVAVTGQAAIIAGSVVEAYVMADDTTSAHSAADHRYLPMFASFSCGTVVAGTGFTIFARSTEQLEGTYALRWVWV